MFQNVPSSSHSQVLIVSREEYKYSILLQLHFSHLLVFHHHLHQGIRRRKLWYEFTKLPLALAVILAPFECEVNLRQKGVHRCTDLLRDCATAKPNPSGIENEGIKGKYFPVPRSVPSLLLLVDVENASTEQRETGDGGNGLTSHVTSWAKSFYPSSLLLHSANPFWGRWVVGVDRKDALRRRKDAGIKIVM